VVITNLRFVGGARVERISIVTLDDKNLAIVSGRAPVFVECLSKGTQ
jgi:hypothetical protein